MAPSDSLDIQLSLHPQSRQTIINKMNTVIAITAARGRLFAIASLMDWNKEANALYQSAGAEIEPATTFCRIRDDALRAFAA